MILNNPSEIEDLLAAVKLATGNVWLISQYGDKFNLKSVLSSYVAIATMIKDHNNALELFCDKKEDEALFFRYFKNHPQTI